MDATEGHRLTWFTSSYSSGNGQCVETAKLPEGGMAVRDTKNPAGNVLSFTTKAWHTFLAQIAQD